MVDERVVDSVGAVLLQKPEQYQHATNDMAVDSDSVSTSTTAATSAADESHSIDVQRLQAQQYLIDLLKLNGLAAKRWFGLVGLIDCF